MRACTEPGKKNPACCAASPAQMSVPQSPQDCGSAGARATGGLGKRPGQGQARQDSALAGRERGRRASAAHRKSSLEAISTRNHREKTNFSRGVSPREVSHSVLVGSSLGRAGPRAAGKRTRWKRTRSGSKSRRRHCPWRSEKKTRSRRRRSACTPHRRSAAGLLDLKSQGARTTKVNGGGGR